MLLAIDSATRTLSLALHDGSEIRVEMTWQTTSRHTIELAPAIQYLLKQIGQTTSILTLLAVAQGPGSFNGLRIGLSVAKGLALALALPLIAVPTLDVIAAGQPPAGGVLIAVAQAGRGRICAGSYRWHSDAEGWIGGHDVRIASWQAVLEALSGTLTTISGEIDSEGHAAIAEYRVRTGRTITAASPGFALRRAGFLAQVAWQRWRSGSVSGDPAAVIPFYLHQPGVPHS